MRCASRFPGLMLLLALILAAAAGCAEGNPAKRTPTVAQGASTCLLVFSTVDKGPSEADYRIEDYETTLYDLDSRTGAIRWKSPTYSGQPVADQRPVMIGTRAFFAIAANSLDLSTSSASGSVGIYAVDLATGRSTLLTTLYQVYSPLGAPYEFDLEITKLNATTALLRYGAYQDANRVIETLLAFASSPDSQLWRVTLPGAAAGGLIADMAVVNGTVALMLLDTATQVPILIDVNGSDGSVLRKISLPRFGVFDGEFADGMLVAAQTSSPSGSGGWAIAAYSLKDGELVWKRAVNDVYAIVYGVAAGLVLYAHITFQGKGYTPTADDTIAVHANDGSQVWTIPFGVGYEVVGDATHLYYPTHDPGQDTQIVCLDGADGRSIWTRTWPHKDQYSTFVPSNMVVSQGVLYVGLDDRSGPKAVLVSPSTVYAFSAATGSTLWQQNIPGDLGYLVETAQP